MADPRRVAAAAVLAGTAVAVGAFGAHAMGTSDPRATGLLETGSHYQLFHAIAVVAIQSAAPPARIACDLLLAGAILFPVSLYALALGAPKFLAVLAPVGGTALLAGWAFLAITTWRARS